MSVILRTFISECQQKKNEKGKLQFERNISSFRRVHYLLNGMFNSVNYFRNTILYTKYLQKMNALDVSSKLFDSISLNRLIVYEFLDERIELLVYCIYI